MKKLLIIIYLITGVARAQKLPDYGIYKVHITESDKILEFEIYPSGKAVTAVPGKWYQWYAANQIQSTQGGYSGTLLNGIYRSYYLNKNLMEQGNFSGGLRDGTWKQWQGNGVLKELVTWKDGVRSGKFVTYTDSGTVKLSGIYKNGLMDGFIRTYNSKDSVSATYYHNGVITEHRSLLQRLPLIRKRHRAETTIP